jgi:hypothetical protein
MDENQLEQLMAMGGSRTMADVRKLIRAYFYSDPKVGKTDLTAQICQELGLSPIWVTTDSGWSTVLKYPEIAERTRFETFDSFAQLRLIVQAHQEGYEPYASHDTLVIDTASRAIDDMLRVVVAERPLPKEQLHPSIEAWGHYRMVESSLKDTIKVIKESDMHVFYLAHIRDPNDKDKEKKRFAIRPAGPEACYRLIAQEANLIGWLLKEGQKLERKIQFNPTLQETAGTQIPTIEEKTYLTTEVPKLLAKYVNS